MSTNNNNSIATKALLEMDAITKSIKEESKNTIKTMLSEAVKTALREAVEDDDEQYEVQDGEEQDTEDQSAETEDAQAAEQEVPAEGEQPEADANLEGEDAEWADAEQYNVGDDTYDLTGVEDPNEVVKVWKLLKNSDEVVVKKTDDGKLELKDNGTDAEYVIDLGDEEEAEEPAEGEQPEADTEVETEEPEQEAEEGNEELNESFDVDFDEDESELELDDYKLFNTIKDENPDFDIDDAINAKEAFEEDSLEDEDEYWDRKFSGHTDDEENYDHQPEDEEENDEIAGIELNENKEKSRKTMKKQKETIFEVDLGYTDNYQDKDPIKGLSMTEPSKSGVSCDDGLPKGTEKPWAGKAKEQGKPFGEETIEEGGARTSVKQTHRVKSAGKPKDGRPVRKPHDTAAASEEVLQENKELKKAVLALRKSLNESYVTNVNLGRITKLFLENTTSQAEKVEIINRFANEAKTVEQSNALYENYNKSLKKSVKSNPSINEGVSTAKPLNENKAVKSKDLLDTIDFMNRVLKC